MQKGFTIGDRPLGLLSHLHPPWNMAYAVHRQYRIVAASAIGQSHLAHGGTREDAFTIRALGPWIAVSVADGVGSCSHPHCGAAYTVDLLSSQLLRKSSDSARRGEMPSKNPDPSLIQEDFGFLEEAPWVEDVPTGIWQAGSVGWGLNSPIRDAHPPKTQKADQIESQFDSQEEDWESDPFSSQLSEEMIHQSFARTHHFLGDYARHLEVRIDDLGCTALALLFNTETDELAVGQVGDGALLGLRSSGKVELLTDSMEESDSLQSVYPITGSNWSAHFTGHWWEPDSTDPFCALFAMTDGISADLFYSPGEQWKDWCVNQVNAAKHFTHPSQAASSLLHWLASYKIKGSWDDRTLVMLWREQKEQEKINNGCSDIGSEQSRFASTIEN
jgi:hypothetical protein